MTCEARAFILRYGWRARASHLAQVLEQPVDAIERVRRTHACTRGRVHGFLELFTAWRGRPPAEADWPRPEKTTSGYEWQGPELALLATLVGVHSPEAIAGMLTERLRQLTGDAEAIRERWSVNQHIVRLGLSSQLDLLGGLTTSQAAARAGCTTTLIHQEISRGKLRAFRVGERKVIPVAAFEAWQAQRLPDPPAGWIKLWDIKKQLGYDTSDGLSWKAKNGHIPQALFCAGHRWWIPPAVARDLMHRRKAGLPMPWSGVGVHRGVTQRSYDLWRRRRHVRCAECRAIWQAAGGEPRTFEEFHARWVTIPEATKRHVTAPDGVSATQAAAVHGIDRHTLTHAIANRILPARRVGARWIIRRADLRRWLRRRRPLTSNGGDLQHRQPLTFLHAAQRYRILEEILRDAVDRGWLHVVRRHDGRDGLVPREVAALHAQLGDMSLSEAARQTGLTVPAFRREARICGWRDDLGITAELVRAVRRHRQGSWQLTFAQAAARLGVDVAWIRRAIDAGVLTPLRGVDRRQTRVGRKLVDAIKRRGLPPLPEPWTNDGSWLRLYEAVRLSGVTTSTLTRWIVGGRLQVLDRGPRKVFYAKASIEAAARHYWAHENRAARRTPPAWLVAEQKTSEAA